MTESNPDNERYHWGPYDDGENGWAEGDPDGTRQGLTTILNKQELDIPVQDIESNINAETYRPADGRLAFSVDTKQWFIADGSSWNIRNNTKVVYDGSNLQSAVDNYYSVVVDGEIDVSADSPITLSNECILHGLGTIGGQETGSTNPNSIINDTSVGPTLHASGNNIRILGIGIDNSHSDGVGIRSSGYSFQASHCDIQAGKTDILCNGPDGSSDTPTEPRLNFNRLYPASGGGGAGTIGIHVENQFDSKITNNIVAGFGTAIQVDVNSSYISGNHTYKYPSDTHQVGIRSTAKDHRIVNNRFEGEVEDSGIVIGQYEKTYVVGNLIQVLNDDANGIFVVEDGGWLGRSTIANNMIQVQGSGGSSAGQGINTDNVTVFNNTHIANNIVEGFGNVGTMMVNEAAGAGVAPTASNYFVGQMVENSDDNTIWMKNSAGTMIQIG